MRLGGLVIWGKGILNNSAYALKFYLRLAGQASGVLGNNYRAMPNPEDFPPIRTITGDLVSFSDFFRHTEAVSRIRKLIIESPQEMLEEATRKNVGKFEARRDQPHFNGDEYHGHCEIPGGYEVSWGVSGKRRHPNKFPAVIPKDARAAVAKVLGVKEDLLEAFVSYDSDAKEYFLLLEIR